MANCATVEEALQRYQSGQHVHLGHPDDEGRSVDELREIRNLEIAIMDAIIAYEMKQQKDFQVWSSQVSRRNDSLLLYRTTVD